MTDYRALLVKYIALVGACEGVDFVDRADERGSMGQPKFSKEEVAELERCREESRKHE